MIEWVLKILKGPICKNSVFDFQWKDHALLLFYTIIE